MIKKLFLFLSLLMFSTFTFSQVVPTTMWSDNADTQWYNNQDSEFTITTEAELAGLSVLVSQGNDFSGKTVTLGANLDLGNHLWTPIGKDASNPFSGTFDGNEYVISDLFINLPSDNFVGLFGRCVKATIKNITLKKPTILGMDSVGSLVGNLWNNGKIENCHSTEVSVQAEGDNVGGLVGDIVNDGAIIRSSAQGTVIGGSQVGGLLGSPFDGTTIRECFAAGTVEANHLAGGLIGASVVGFPDTEENVIMDCYSRSNVAVVNGYVGGFCGSAAALLTIINSYSTGTAEGPEYAGGFIGGAGSFLSENNYWDITSSGHSQAVGGWTGGVPGTPDISSKTTTEMKTETIVHSLNDGDGPWVIDESINDGYPSFNEEITSIISFEERTGDLIIYPNLFNEEIHIASNAQLKRYVILDLAGNIIQKGRLKGNDEIIKTRRVKSGMYLLKINSKGGWASKKVVKW